MLFYQKKNLFKTPKTYFSKRTDTVNIHDQINFLRKTKKYIYLISFSTMAYFFFSSIYNTDIELTYKKNNLNNSVFKALNELRIKKFSSTFYLPTRFIQIVYGNRVDSREFLEYTPQILKLPSHSEQLVLNKFPLYSAFQEKETSSTPIVLAIPGLSGNAKAEYMKAQINGLRKEGFRVIAFNPVGNGTPQIGDKIFDYRDLENELDFAVDFLKKEYKGANMYLLGFSLGASYGVKYVAGKGKGKIKGMVSISNPFDVKKAQENLHSYKNFIYNNFLTKLLIRKVLFNKETLDKHLEKNGIQFDYEKFKKSKILKEFDENFTYKVHSEKPDIFEKLSCFKFIKEIDVPVMFINSKNDPISDFSNVPVKSIKENGNLFLVATPKGAHTEYFFNLNKKRWNVRVAAKYLRFLEDWKENFDIETN